MTKWNQNENEGHGQWTNNPKNAIQLKSVYPKWKKSERVRLYGVELLTVSQRHMMKIKLDIRNQTKHRLCKPCMKYTSSHSAKGLIFQHFPTFCYSILFSPVNRRIHLLFTQFALWKYEWMGQDSILTALKLCGEKIYHRFFPERGRLRMGVSRTRLPHTHRHTPLWKTRRLGAKMNRVCSERILWK